MEQNFFQSIFGALLFWYLLVDCQARLYKSETRLGQRLEKSLSDVKTQNTSFVSETVTF